VTSLRRRLLRQPKLHRGAHLDTCARNGTLLLYRRIEERDVGWLGGEIVSGLKPSGPQFDLSVVGALPEHVRDQDAAGTSPLRVVPDLKISEVENECRDSEREAHAHDEDDAELDWVGIAPSPGRGHLRLVLLREDPPLVVPGHEIPVPHGVERSRPPKRGSASKTRRSQTELTRADRIAILEEISRDESVTARERIQAIRVLEELRQGEQPPGTFEDSRRGLPAPRPFAEARVVRI
jgi:uncharacterized protein (UPF0147 family)